MSDVDRLLLHVLLLCLMTGGIAGLFIGTLLVLRPICVLHAGNFVNRWISTRPITRLLERMIKIDRWFYRHHRTSGILLLAGSVFIMYFYSGRFDKGSLIVRLSKAFSIPPAFAEVLLNSAIFGILLGAALALIISLFLLIRPSMLKALEQDANQWVSLRRALKPLEVSRFYVDEYVFQNVKMTGVVLLLGSLYALAGLTVWL